MLRQLTSVAFRRHKRKSSRSSKLERFGAHMRRRDAAELRTMRMRLSLHVHDDGMPTAAYRLAVAAERRFDVSSPHAFVELRIRLGSRRRANATVRPSRSSTQR